MGRRSSCSVALILCVTTFNLYICPSQQFQIDSIGRVVRGHLGTLYDLRNKLGGSTSTTTTTTAVPEVQQQYNRQASSMKKESRSGYSFHYSPTEVQHPMYSPSTSTGVFHQNFHSRMGKVSEATTPSKWKNSEKPSWDKHSKYGYKSSSFKDTHPVNSFNVHQQSSSSSSSSSMEQNESTLVPQVRTTSLPIISSSTAATTAMTPTLDLSPIKALGQGLNTAMTKVLTEKLMLMLDTEVPESFLKPLKHLVASGNRMVDYWDKRTSARDGKLPGIVEMMGYGLDQLKRFRDGQHLKETDNVTDLMSASKTLIQGMFTVKKLTNRVLGYDTDEEAIQSRGGYGHDNYASGGGWGHHVSYGHYLDPYAILATLGFGVFLFNVIFNLLNNNNNMAMASGRSLDVDDVNVPLALSDVMSSFTDENKIFGTPTVRTKRDADDESPFSSIVTKLDGAFKAYQTITEQPKCSRLYLCRVAVQDALGNGNSLFSQLYMLGLGHLAKDKTALDFIKSIQNRVADGEDVDCDNIVKECVPKELKDKI